MRPTPRLLALLACALLACGPSTGAALRVLVSLEPGAHSRCVKVTVFQGDGGARESAGGAPRADGSPLRFAVYEDGTEATTAVEATGYEADCATLQAPPEASARVNARYGFPEPGLVELLLRAGDAGPPDAGPPDAGPPDAGSPDAGSPDAGSPDAGLACSSGVPFSCTEPVPSCQARFGCGDGSCVLRPAAAGDACSDGLVCTGVDHCDGDGGCLGGVPACTSPPGNACLTASCSEPTGCAVVPAPAGVCSDGDACTQSDACLADGGCGGTPIVCPPPGECRAAGACDAGACVYVALVGPCAGGACNGLGQCVPDAGTFRTYLPSNFTEAQLPPFSPAGLTITCASSIDTRTQDGGLAFTGCPAGTPSLSVILQGGGAGPEAALLFTGPFTVASGGSLTVVGDRPLVIAVVGDADLAGPLTTSAGADRACAPSAALDGSPDAGGGGGGGFGAPGGRGANGGLSGTGGTGLGLSGNAELVPLRGGCRGGLGAIATDGGTGGGAVQISATGDIVVHAALSAPGGGGAGGPVDHHGGGGGGSGGAILLEANRVTIGLGGSLTANGGGGGEGSSSVAGAVGEPGSVTLLGAAGGNGGTCGGNGGRGGALLPASAGATPTTNTATCRAAGGGGGGGGVGRIRLNVLQPCTLGALVIPAPTGCP